MIEFFAYIVGLCVFIYVWDSVGVYKFIMCVKSLVILGVYDVIGYYIDNISYKL